MGCSGGLWAIVGDGNVEGFEKLREKKFSLSRPVLLIIWGYIYYLGV